jgi:hypothetical protein
MKTTNVVGNTSQSIIPVPNFFLTRKLKSIDTFTNNNTRSRKYFSETELFKKTRDLNFSHNKRNNDKAFEEYNMKRIVPKHRKEVKTISSSLNSLTDFAPTTRVPEEMLEYEKFSQYMERVNSQVRSKEIKDEMVSNINNIIDKLSPNYIVESTVLKKRSETNFKTNYSTLNSLSDFKARLNYFTAETETEKFQNSIKNKIHNLTKNHFLKTSYIGSNNTSGFLAPKATKSSEFIHNSLTNKILTSTHMPVITDLNKAYASSTDFKMDTMSNGVTDIRIPFRNRKYDEKTLMDTEKYNCRLQRHDYKPRESNNQLLYFK